MEPLGHTGPTSVLSVRTLGHYTDAAHWTFDSVAQVKEKKEYSPNTSGKHATHYSQNDSSGSTNTFTVNPWSVNPKPLLRGAGGTLLTFLRIAS